MRRWIPILAAAVFCVGIAPRVNALPKEGAERPATRKTMPGMRKMPAKKMMAKGVYVCKVCKVAYTPAQARKMGYKDPMGHRMTRMAKLPPGVRMMGKTPMKGKMPMRGKMPMKGKMPMRGGMAPMKK